METILENRLFKHNPGCHAGGSPTWGDETMIRDFDLSDLIGGPLSDIHEVRINTEQLPRIVQGPYRELYIEFTDSLGYHVLLTFNSPRTAYLLLEAIYNYIFGTINREKDLVREALKEKNL